MASPSWEDLSEEDRFYGIREYGGGKWRRIEYNYDPEIRRRSNWFTNGGFGVVELFDSFAVGVYDFCETKNVALEKHFKEISAWMLQFYHPKGGLGRIDIFYQHPHPDMTAWHSSNIETLIEADANPEFDIVSMWSSPHFNGPLLNKHTQITYPVSPLEMHNELREHYGEVCSMATPPDD